MHFMDNVTRFIFHSQRFDATSGEFEILDKMFGRQLNDSEVKSQIVNFLFDGQDFRMELVNSILYQLSMLKNVMEQLEGHRFYSSSLLIIYEGCVQNIDGQTLLSQSLPVENQPGATVDILMHKDSEVSKGSESRNCDKTYKKMSDKHVCNRTRDVCNTSMCLHKSGKTRGAEVLCKCHMSKCFGRSCTLNESVGKQLRHSKIVDIRIVDFAHATFDGFLGDTVKHYGPDHGFLLGVDTLLEIFTDLKGKCVF